VFFPPGLTLGSDRGWFTAVFWAILRRIIAAGLLSQVCLASDSNPWTVGNGFRSRPLTPESGRKPGFTEVNAGTVGITFTNHLHGDAFLTNTVAHNGSGVAIGDIDGDGLQDIYFASLQGGNHLYRNRGNWHFEEMELGDAACREQFSTGVCFADIDGDGDLDLLVNGIASGTRLFLNDGKGHFTEKLDSGLSRSASANSMALADIDGDGDLDLYCTHYTDAVYLADPTVRFALARNGEQWEVAKINGESTRSPRWKGRFEALPNGKVRELPEIHALYRNDGNGHFTPIQNESGTYQDEDGKPIPPFRDWGLGVMFRDINGDGIPDIYVCNDNVSPDRIWINSGRGTFRALPTPSLRHTSRSSMGVDFADLDRDGQDDFIVVDMLAREPSKRLTQLVRDRPAFADLSRILERPQFNRNTLFFGRPDGTFIEAALWAGVAATDWSWTVICLDVDLDGYEDLLMTNGFESDVMDQDSHNLLKDRTRRWTEAQLKRSMQLHPRWATRNAAFRNRGDGSFEPTATSWGFDHPGVSFGMAAADLDNDGDLDLVVNNLNEAPTLYRNDAAAGRIAIQLKGKSPNTEAIGARIRLSGGAVTQSQEMICGGRYLSAGQAIRVFAADPALGSAMKLEVRWRDGGRTVIPEVQANRLYEITEPVTQDPLDASLPKAGPLLFEDVSQLIHHVHAEEDFDDWARTPTLPRRLSHLGPAIAWYDFDGDGWQDLIVGGGASSPVSLFLNDHGQHFVKTDAPPAIVGDAAGVVGWPDGLGHRNLLVATSNYKLPPKTESSVLIFSSTKLTSAQSLPAGPAALGALALADVDGDGTLDVFVAGRFSPGRYPEPASSAVWLNKDGKLTPSAAWSEPFKNLGLVVGATFADLDNDGRPDLALAMEWGPVRVFLNRNGHFEDVSSAWKTDGMTGWWTGIVAGDFNGDGRIDLACGNSGRNTVYELYPGTGIRLYYQETAGGGFQMLEAWSSGKEWFPIHDRSWLEAGFPGLASSFPTHEIFSRTTVGEILKPADGQVRFVETVERASLVLLNQGGSFKSVPLPREAQWSPVFSLNVADFDGDGIEDLFCSQNFFGTATDISRDDAGRGLILKGIGDGTFTAIDAAQSGIRVLGEQRGAAVADFNQDGRVDIAVTQNGASTLLYANRSAKPGLRLVLEGPAANPDAIGAQLQVIYRDRLRGPLRQVQSGSGYWSQDAPTQILGLREQPVAVFVRWPGGREQTAEVGPNDRVVTLKY